ncbi:MAG: 30S ribosomal protein S13 [Candidatus Omnitrophica bacterium]|nr:30S ribosomal protein S13 [Candidatus Omnitrophota bacterium]
MPRIAGVDIPKEKKIRIALQYLNGVGPTNCIRILSATGIDPDKKAGTLTDEEVSKVAAYIQANYKIEGELRREITQNIRRLVDIGCYRGSRHKKGLPVRGQRTKCNARTRKGPRPRVGGVKRKGE